MKAALIKAVIAGVLFAATIGAYGGAFKGWFLPERLDKPISLKDGSKRAGARGYGLYFLGTRRHRGGGYAGGK